MVVSDFGQALNVVLFAALSGLALAGLPACGSQEPDSTGGADGSAGSGGRELGLVFRPPTTLTIEPRQQTELTVASNLPGRYVVRFALLSGGESGAPADAALDRTETETDAGGVGHVMLTGPSSPGTFSVRASIDDGPSTTLSVSVSASGFVELEVRPAYSGVREVETWTATVRAGITCDQLAGTPPPDGDLIASADYPATPVVTAVPVGRALAVTVRAGQFIGGCTTLDEVKEGERNRVVVPAADRPIQLDSSKLGVAFGMGDVTEGWAAAIAQAKQEILDGLLGGAPSEAEAMLDAINQVVPPAQKSGFAEARIARGWDAALQGVYTDKPRVLRDAALTWLDEGELELHAPDAVLGQLTADEDDPERALLTLLSVAGYAPEAAGLPATAPAGWSADSHDTLLVGSNLLWSPHRLLGALAQGPALDSVDVALTVGRALAVRLDCSLLASTILNSGQPQGEIYPDCGLSCAVTACRTALELMWQRGLDSSDADLPLFSLSASATAQVDSDAQISTLTGTWVGRFSTELEGATASGPFAGAASE